MHRRIPLILLLAVIGVAVVVGTSQSAMAATTAVRDGANLFSPATEAEAFKVLSDIEARTGLDSLVEAVPTLPPDVTRQIEARPDHRGAILRQWAEDRARSENVGGVYIGIAKSPGVFQLEPSGRAGRLLPKSELDRVVSTMRESFKRGDFDGGLIAGLSDMRDRMTANASVGGAAVEPSPGAATPSPRETGSTGTAAPSGSTQTPAPTSGGRGFSFGACIVPLLIGVVLLFILRRVFASRSQQGAPWQQQGYGGPPPTPGQGGYDPRYGGQPGQPGGGFGRGVAGGLLGGLAGGYLYDKMTGGNQSQAAPPSDPNAPGGDQGLHSGGGSDAGAGEGGGGFFGDSGGGDSGGGGGDFGGGDGGGGDF